MWAAIAGLGPLLKTRRPGAFLDVDGKQAQWWVEGNAAGVISDGIHIAHATATNTQAKHIETNIDLAETQEQPVAVLLGPDTASAGEAIAVAFKGSPLTRFFGTETAGFASANEPIELHDGAVMYVTSGWLLDRIGNRVFPKVQPDTLTSVANAATEAQVWMKSAGTCSAP